MTKRDQDYTFKLILIGDSSVGKTNLLERYCDNTFNNYFYSTIGVDFKIKMLEYKNLTIKLQIWDTAGQERFRTLTVAFYRGSHGILIVFDITDKSSFNNIKRWLTEINMHINNHTKIVIVGTKCDLKDLRQVSHDEAQECADNLGFQYIETSSKENINVETLFTTLIQDILISKDVINLTTNTNATNINKISYDNDSSCIC